MVFSGSPPCVLGKQLSAADALRFVDEWLAQIDAGRGGNLISDTHLATIAIEYGAALGSFDADFERLAGLRFDYLAADTVHES